MAKVHQFILNAFNAGAIVFMMGDDSDQMEFATETGTPLMSYNVERGRAEEIMAVPEVIELTRKARADEYISIAEFDDTINAIKKVNGFGSWLLNKGANQVQLRNMLGALDRDAPPSPPIAGRKDAIMERPEVSRINPVIIRDESGIEIYLQPYISNIMASGGDKVETVGVALCLHFADNAAANEFISTHKYEGIGLDRRRIGYSTEGERRIKLSEGQIYLEAITCTPMAVDVLFHELKTAWLDTNLPKFGVNLSDATKNKIGEYYCNEQLQEKGEISPAATRPAETAPASAVVRLDQRRQPSSGVVASPAAVPVTPIRRVNPIGNLSGQTFIVIDDEMNVLLQTDRIISQAGGTVIPITTDNKAICNISKFKRKPSGVDSRDFLLNVLSELVAANPQAIILSDMKFDPIGGFTGLELAEDLRSRGYPQAFILWTGGIQFAAPPKACDAVLDKQKILLVTDEVAAIGISSAVEYARESSLERMQTGGQQLGRAGGQVHE